MGLTTVILGRKALGQVGFRAASEPTLYRLATDTGLAANLAVLDGERVLVVDRIEGLAFQKAAVQESSRMRRTPQPELELDPKLPLTREFREATYELPVCSTALGKVLLAYAPIGQFDQLVDGVSSKEELWRGGQKGFVSGIGTSTSTRLLHHDVRAS